VPPRTRPVSDCDLSVRFPEKKSGVPLTLAGEDF